MPNKPEIISGKNVLFEVLKAGRRKVFKVFWARKTREEKSETLKTLVLSRNIPLVESYYEAITNLTDSSEHQGVAAEVADFQYAALEPIVEKTKKDPKGGFLVLLDEIQDPHNVGALIRTTHLCGASGLVLLKHRQALITNAVCKAAAGAQEYLPIIKAVNLVNTINYLKKNDFSIYGACGETKNLLFNEKFKFPCGLIVGSEGKGLRRLVRENCDRLIAIPMEGKIDSFNVSVAGGIFMGEILRQRILSA